MNDASLLPEFPQEGKGGVIQHTVAWLLQSLDESVGSRGRLAFFFPGHVGLGLSAVHAQEFEQALVFLAHVANSIFQLAHVVPLALAAALGVVAIAFTIG